MRLASSFIAVAGLAFSALGKAQIMASNFTAFTQLNSSYTAGNGTFLVGAGKVDITPEPNPQWLPLNEYAFERIYVRAIVFQNNGVYGAIINCELATVSDAVFTAGNKYVADLLNTSTSNVLFGLTHAHGANPAGGTSLNYGSAAVTGYESLGLAGLAAAKIALGNMRPAKVGWNNGTAHFGVNSCHINKLTGRWTQATNTSGPVDPSVQVLSFVGLDDVPIATWTSYAMHPVNSYLSGYTNGDWPGAMMRWIEQSFDDRDDFVAVMSLSASADVNPLMRRTSANSLAAQQNVPISGYERTQEPLEEPLRDGYAPMKIPQVKYTRQLLDVLQAMGILLGEETIRLMSTTEDWNSNPNIYSRQVLTSCPGRSRIDDAREGVPGVYTPGPVNTIRTGILAFDDIVLACVGSGIYTDIGYAIKSNSTMPKTMIVAMINGQTLSGYLVAANSWEQETFQALNAKIAPGPCGQLNVSLPLGAMISNYQKTYFK
ncbi:hypothetical protein SBRCBS47491_001648 [Sporothrix bragantina]|uniref:Neutral/alkaline non-lysosomal ceramidase N-terminal domain-containing protein n=1 Tax=Sporothrix bragantina TaxID=671064 RepID=A0ABP0B0B4_9PEZI